MTINSKPLLHIGGTPKQHLYEGYADVYHHLLEAIGSLKENGPHSRDYDQVTTSYQQAVKDHQERVKAIESVIDEIYTLLEHVA